MCIVSFVPARDKIFITSNRDEKESRKRALPPSLHHRKGATLLFPTDGEKGGSWIVAREEGDAGVLLNGALTPHIPKESYRQSRGVVLLALMETKDPLQQFSKHDLLDIEPFTLILFINKRLWQCRWTGTVKTVCELDAGKPHIWSSASLYTPVGIAQREIRFRELMRQNRQFSQTHILEFHATVNYGDPINDLRMNNKVGVRTVSITSLAIEQGLTKLAYLDTLEGKSYKMHYNHKDTVTKLPAKKNAKRFWIRLTHWEYWPFALLYTPVFFYWFWLSIKARSLLFFSTSNPTIRNSGFLMESKKEIYDLLPPQTYPTTVFVPLGQSFLWVEHLVAEAHLVFPLIVKPDIGLRGIGVTLVHNKVELNLYHQQSKVDYLVQAYVTYPNEVGIFYFRMPDEEEGQISGIVRKEFLKVRGDGYSTMEELLKKDDRFFLQLPVLQAIYGATLAQVPTHGEERLLVPFGNHSRGTKFVDATHLLNDNLRRTIDGICKQVPAFHFGRLDIKYDKWEAFCDGKNFSIIELNGAGSESAHIYDPTHSVFFAWKEIIRHLAILYRVSIRNKKQTGLRFMTISEGLKMFRDNKAHMQKIRPVNITGKG